MRVIAGEFRGRQLLPPAGDVTRPITDRVKQSLFDILTPLLHGARIADCFAGTGSMGLECVSRGASFAHFFESDRSAAVRLRQNIANLAVGDRCKVIAGDLFRWFANPAHHPGPESRFDVLFLDPPYRFLREQPGAMQALASGLAGYYLSPGGIVVFRHDAQDALELPPLRRYDQRDYGGMTLEFLQINRGATDPPPAPGETFASRS